LRTRFSPVTALLAYDRWTQQHPKKPAIQNAETNDEGLDSGRNPVLYAKLSGLLARQELISPLVAIWH
jgi:hypothetical protein